MSKYLDYAGAPRKGWPIATGIIGVPISATGRSAGMKIVLGLARDAGDAWH